MRDPITNAFVNHNVSASVCDIELSKRGFSIKTRYVIQVKSTSPIGFKKFKTSKRFKDFRVLVSKLKKATQPYKKQANLSRTKKEVLQVTKTIAGIIESENVEYLGKINYSHVKNLSSHRKPMIDSCLQTITKRFPSSDLDDPMVKSFMGIVETFFLQDRQDSVVQSKRDLMFEEVNSDSDTDALSSVNDMSNYHTGMRNMETIEEEETSAKEVSGDPLKINDELVINLVILFSVFLALSYTSTTISSDYLLLTVLISYFLGLHTPSYLEKRALAAQENKVQNRLRKSMNIHTYSKKILQKSLSVHHTGGEDKHLKVISPLPEFPKNGDPLVHLNCWSEPDASGFKVRGPKYFKDSVKVSSGPHLLPMRCADLFLTDMCPSHVGRNSGICGGEMRDTPTFLINFRLPWGVFIIYYSIPEKFLPFLRSNDVTTPKSGENPTLPSTENMTSGERTLCRFFSGDDYHRNSTLKIIPAVVESPWIVKSVVKSKPAIIGNKLPVKYVYHPADAEGAEYLEADLDIAGSSAARGILSVCRSYTKSLTLDLGFVVQSEKEDELPEQMMCSVRIHGLDPLSAGYLPMSAADIHPDEED